MNSLYYLLVIFDISIPTPF